MWNLVPQQRYPDPPLGTLLFLLNVETLTPQPPSLAGEHDFTRHAIPSCDQCWGANDGEFPPESGLPTSRSVNRRGHADFCLPGPLCGNLSHHLAHNRYRQPRILAKIPLPFIAA